MFMPILSNFVKYIRIFISKEPEELLKIIKFHKIIDGVINCLKKKKLFLNSFNFEHSIKNCGSSSVAHVEHMAHGLFEVI